MPTIQVQIPGKKDVSCRRHLKYTPGPHELYWAVVPELPRRGLFEIVNLVVVSADEQGALYRQRGAKSSAMCHVVRHWGFNLLTNLASGIPAADSHSRYRTFSPRAIEAITFASQRFSVESEMQFLAHDLGLRIKEIPITIQYQDKPKRNVLKHGLLVLNGIHQLAGQHGPLLFLPFPECQK